MKSFPILATARARTAIGIGLSLLIHALILFFAVDRADVRVAETGDSPTAPLTVNLIAQLPEPKAKSTAIAPPPSAPKKATRPAEARAEKSRPRKKSEPDVAQTRPPPLAPTAPTVVPPEMDMTDMLAAARERRRAAGIREPESGDSGKAASDDSAIARANVEHMMQMSSRGRNESGGVFQITFKGVRTGEFLFRGWDVRRRTNSRQLITVDAPNGDIETAIVRKMIELIRQHEKEDFNWESPRVGRVVILSARVKDSAELEEFLKRDFFEVR